MEQQTIFNVLDRLTPHELVELGSDKDNTYHAEERYSRYSVYADLNMLSTNFIDGFVVDKGHVNGPELHAINSNGLIYIFNQASLKAITILSARPAQIKRYYRALGINLSPRVQQAITIADNNNNKHNTNKV